MKTRKVKTNTLPDCPEFHPTLVQMQDFAAYIAQCEKDTEAGMFKILPPDEWEPRKEGYENVANCLTLKTPIRQQVTGENGIYEILNIESEIGSLERFIKKAQSHSQTSVSTLTTEEREHLFWSTIAYRETFYGSDQPGSLFDQGVPFSLAELNTILQHGLDVNIPGVNTPYLYFGSWKSMFAWHAEDLDLNAINYLHHGDPKVWYAIELKSKDLFEETLKQQPLFLETASVCPAFLRHKTAMVSPYLLAQKGVTLLKTYQRQREFVVLRNGVYHSGFNSGYNIAEAVNFATPDWLSRQIGLKAKRCRCRSDQVSINLAKFIVNLMSGLSSEINEIPFSLTQLQDMYARTLSYYDEHPYLKTGLNLKRGKRMAALKKKEDLEEKKQRILQTLGVTQEAELWRECDLCHKERRLSGKDAKLFIDKNFQCSALDTACESDSSFSRHSYLRIRKFRITDHTSPLFSQESLP